MAHGPESNTHDFLPSHLQIPDRTPAMFSKSISTLRPGQSGLVEVIADFSRLLWS